MDFSEQIVAAWAKQDLAVSTRTQPVQRVQSASAMSVNKNGRMILTAPDGSVLFNPTNSNAAIPAGTGLRTGSGMAFAKVASV